MRQWIGAFAFTAVLVVSGTVGAAAQEADILEPAPQVGATLYCYPPADATSNDAAPAARQVVTVTEGWVWHQSAVQRGYTCSPERQ